MSTDDSKKRARSELDDTEMQGCCGLGSPCSKKQKSNRNQTALSAEAPTDNVWPSPESCLSWLLSKEDSNPNDVLKDFVANYWSQKPFLLQRGNAEYYKSKGVDIGLDTIYEIVQDHEEMFTFGQNIICKHYDAETKTEVNAKDRGDLVDLKELKSLFNNQGATIQFLHSHFYHFEIGNLIFNLESYFGNFVSSNIYITPNRKQGLKAHWDDIEAFILQIRGRKQWKLYALNEDEQFPINESHRDLEFDDESKYKLLLDCTLSPGDLLYFPRGTVHFAQCVDSKEGDDYSLHLTVSTNQNNHYGHFLKMAMNQCLDDLIQSDVRFRRNVPINIIDAVGTELNVPTLNEQQRAKEQQFHSTMDGLWDVLKTKMFGDTKGFKENARKVVDQMAVNFMSNRYPPTTFLKPDEFAVFGRDENQIKKEHDVEPEMTRKDELINEVEDGDNRRSIVDGESEVRWVDPKWVRIVTLKDVNAEMESDAKDLEEAGEEEEADLMRDGDNLLLYSCVKNDPKTHLMAYEGDVASAPMMALASDRQLFLELTKQSPEWIKVKDLADKCPDCDVDRICDLLFALWADGVLETKKHH